MAWPTVILLVAMCTLWFASAAAGVSGKAAVWVAILGASVADYAAFTLMHEASHGLVGRKRRVLNQVAGELCSTFLMCRFNGFRQVHLRHHRHAGNPEKDPDNFAGGGPFWLLPLRWATADLNYWFEFDDKARIPKLERRLSDLTWYPLLALLAVALYLGFWKELLLFWVLPARIALVVSTYFFDYLPHQRPHTVDRRVNPFQTSANLRGGPVLDVLLMGHTLHLVHHLHPAVPFYRLRALYRRIRPDLLARGAREVWPFTSPRPYTEEPAPTPVLPAESAPCG